MTILLGFSLLCKNHRGSKVVTLKIIASCKRFMRWLSSLNFEIKIKTRDKSSDKFN